MHRSFGILLLSICLVLLGCDGSKQPGAGGGNDSRPADAQVDPSSAVDARPLADATTEADAAATTSVDCSDYPGPIDRDRAICRVLKLSASNASLRPVTRAQAASLVDAFGAFNQAKKAYYRGEVDKAQAERLAAALRTACVENTGLTCPEFLSLPLPRGR